MNRRLRQIQARQAQLLERSAEQRLALSRAYRRWHTPLRYADLGFALARGLTQRPYWLTWVSAGVRGTRLRGAGKWVARAWSAWTVFRLARDWRLR